MRRTQCFRFCYEDDLSIEDKIDAIVRKVYGGTGAVFTQNAKNQIETLNGMGFSLRPVCMAKTQYSFSDDPSKLGVPKILRLRGGTLKFVLGLVLLWH